MTVKGMVTVIPEEIIKGVDFSYLEFYQQEMGYKYKIFNESTSINTDFYIGSNNWSCLG